MFALHQYKITVNITISLDLSCYKIIQCLNSFSDLISCICCIVSLLTLGGALNNRNLKAYMTLFCPACLTSVFKTKIKKKGHACNENGDGASDPFI